MLDLINDYFEGIFDNMVLIFGNFGWLKKEGKNSVKD